MLGLILNVDDFEPQLYLRSAALRGAGFEVIEARTGTQALALVRDRRPTMVLLDVHLPDIDGFEVCRKIKQDPGTASVLVLHVSATFSETGARIKGLRNGADGYLIEPLDPEELVAQVNALLRVARAEAAQRRVEEALREANTRYQRVLSSITEGYYRVDTEWRFTEMNEVAADHFARPRAELLGTGLWAATGVSAGSLFYENLVKAVATGQTVHFEAESLVRPGRWSELHAHPRDGGLDVYFHDITKRKEAEERQLKLSQELADRMAELQALLDVVPAPVWFAHDPACARITGNAYADELVMNVARGGNVSRSAAPGEAAVTYRVFREGVELRPEDLPAQVAAATGKRVFDHDQELRFDDGRVVHLMLAAVPLFDARGKVRGSVTAGADVTRLKQVEAALRESEDLLRARASELQALLDSVPAGVFVSRDRESRQVETNRFSAEFLHMPAGRNVSMSAPPEERPTAFRFMKDGVEIPPKDLPVQVSSREGVEVRDCELDIVYNSGETRTLFGNVTPLLAENGEPSGAVGAFVDITRRKQAERALQETSERLVQANRVKDEFLATLSHELRTPLNAILGWSQMLALRPLDSETTRRAMAAISRNAQAQAQLVSDVLDVSRIVTGQLRLTIEAVDLRAVLKNALESVAPAADAKGLSIQTDIAGETSVSGDPARLQQVLWNLLSNAVKFTPPGGQIRVSSRREGSQVELTVSDSGIGISPAFLPRVFERFAQADASTTRRHGGLGLGLAIVRHLVELHGGIVRAESEGEGRGATFTIRLPVRAVRRRNPNEEQATDEADDETSSAATSHALRGVAVLVVDDEPDALELFEAILTRHGATVGLAGSARDAIEALAARRYDVLCADIGMPGEDGYALINRVRGLSPKDGGEIPAVALTAYGRAEDRARALGSGFQHHVSKPVLPGELVAVISSLVSSDRRRVQT